MPLKLTWGIAKIAKRSFFSNPFRFFLVLAISPFFAFKTDLGNCQKEFFLEPFSFFFVFFSFWLFFPFFAFKIDLGNCQKELFLEPFSLFFRYFFVICFLPSPLKLT